MLHDFEKFVLTALCSLHFSSALTLLGAFTMCVTDSVLVMKPFKSVRITVQLQLNFLHDDKLTMLISPIKNIFFIVSFFIMTNIMFFVNRHNLL